MSCIELYRGDLCHFHLLSIENIANFVTCSSIRAVCARACVCVRVCVCVCVCVWWLGMGVDKFIQNQADGGGVGELANVASIVDKLFKKIKRILIENTGYNPNFRL